MDNNYICNFKSVFVRHYIDVHFDQYIFDKNVVKHPCSYYVLTTFHVLNLPRFAAFCSFCDIFNNLRAKYMVGKLRQIGAEHGILGGFSFMIKVLFVCHGKPDGKGA